MGSGEGRERPLPGETWLWQKCLLLERRVAEKGFSFWEKGFRVEQGLCQVFLPLSEEWHHSGQHVRAFK